MRTSAERIDVDMTTTEQTRSSRPSRDESLGPNANFTKTTALSWLRRDVPNPRRFELLSRDLGDGLKVVGAARDVDVTTGVYVRRVVAPPPPSPPSAKSVVAEYRTWKIIIMVIVFTIGASVLLVTVIRQRTLYTLHTVEDTASHNRKLPGQSCEPFRVRSEQGVVFSEMQLEPDATTAGPQVAVLDDHPPAPPRRALKTERRSDRDVERHSGNQIMWSAAV